MFSTVVLSPHQFSIGDTNEMAPYQHDGVVRQIKTNTTASFVSTCLANNSHSLVQIIIVLVSIRSYLELAQIMISYTTLASISNSHNYVL